MIKVKDLSKRFGSVTAVDRLNFNVKPGEVFGLLGPNATGKTTTFSILCTIFKPTFGTATINGFDISNHASQVRKSIGIVAYRMQQDQAASRLTGVRLSRPAIKRISYLLPEPAYV